MIPYLNKNDSDELIWVAICFCGQDKLFRNGVRFGCSGFYGDGKIGPPQRDRRSEEEVSEKKRSERGVRDTSNLHGLGLFSQPTYAHVLFFHSRKNWILEF